MTAFERGTRQIAERARNSYRYQRTAFFKRFFVNVFYRIEIQRRQARAMFKRAFRDVGKGIGRLKRDKRFAMFKREFTDLFQSFRENDLFQRAAVSERLRAKFGEPGRQFDRFERPAP